MKPSHDSGQFTTEIAQDVLDDAVKAVEKQHVPVADPASPAELAELKLELEASMAIGRDLKTKLTDEHEKMLRVAADLENYKKRAHKEKEEIQRFGIEKLLRDFLPVFDNLDRALDAAKSPADYESLRTGVEMIRRLFEDTLGKHGVKAFSAKGLPFDPNRHEAISSAETTELPPNSVYSEMLRGFTLNERLVRPALVVVSRAPDATPPAEPVDAPPADTSSKTSL